MISVCIATYNGGEFIIPQLNSILSQLGPCDEVIISDDRSSDNTVSLIRSLRDERVRIVQNHRPPGYTNNFQSALELAKGEFIFLSDQDDVWHDCKIKIVMNQMQKYDFVVHDAEVVDSKLNLLSPSIFQDRKAKQGFLNNFYKINYLGCCMAFRREVLEKALPFPGNRNYVTHDSWLTLIAEAYFKVKLLNKPLLLYRRHGGNTSLGGEDEGNSLLKKISIRSYSLFHVTISFFR
ncbi:glycosyltransferase family 2 protein [Vibrio sp. OPT20]|uniref:glycosyltransferase family 2 protein n=1 Tax=Vibrio sp. OPT20 TaxID=2778642 RepID=UPI00187E18E9|nr:glycosyltransferase family 2 protein [Vibrio sp. OPT20]MBE8564344.1 glycosyltransferase family 2 protein [Vibrio sp. OPT20]